MSLFENKLLKRAGVVVGAIGAINTFLPEASAEIKPVELSRSKIEFLYSSPDHPRPITFEFKTLKNFGTGQMDGELLDVLVDQIKQTDVKLDGVNYNLHNRAGLKKKIEDQLPVIKKNLKIPALNLLPNHVSLIAEYLLKNNFSYEHRIGGVESIDKKVESEIDATPLDDLFGKKGVCRHAAALFSLLGEIVTEIELPHSPGLGGLIFDEVDELNRGHAVNSMTRAFVRGGNAVIENGTADITETENKKGFQVDLQRSLDDIDEVILAFLKVHIFPRISELDRMDILKHLLTIPQQDSSKQTILNILYLKFSRRLNELKNSKKEKEEITNFFWDSVKTLEELYQKEQKNKNVAMAHYILDILPQLFGCMGDLIEDQAKAHDLYRLNVGRLTTKDQPELKIMAYSMLSDRLYGAGVITNEVLEASQGAYSITSEMEPASIRRFELGIKYANILVDSGDTKKAVEVLEELFQEYIRANGKEPFLVNEYTIPLYINGQEQKFPLFHDRIHFEQYLKYRGLLPR